MDAAALEGRNFSLAIRYLFEKSTGDPRIGPGHISLYMALLHLWHDRQCPESMALKSAEIMPLAKISGSATYHRLIRELDEYGFIRYEPSHNRFVGSRIAILISSNGK